MDVDYRLVDRNVYESELSQWLPPSMIDIHVHLSLPQHSAPISPERMSVLWPVEVGIHQSWQDLREAYRLLLPKQDVSVLAFGSVYKEVDTVSVNNYVFSGMCDSRNNADALFVTRPEYEPYVIEEAMHRGFLGIKPYPDLAPQDTQEISIFDFLPRKHLEVLDRLGGILMLHIPRAGRLGDPNNVREIIEIADKYPSVKLIVAHIGRAYCLPTAKKGLPALADKESIYFDIAANLNADVFQYTLDLVGPERILFGSDLPITLMHGCREHVGEKYINYTDGPYSWNTNRKSPDEEAQYTCYLYEELRALIKAVERLGLGKDAFENIVYHNAIKLLGK
ncbi:MAG: amidohydrolase family protein [Armatimonadota bacterium]|nr:amidohydrolase [bacterium]